MLVLLSLALVVVAIGLLVGGLLYGDGVALIVLSILASTAAGLVLALALRRRRVSAG